MTKVFAILATACVLGGLLAGGVPGSAFAGTVVPGTTALLVTVQQSPDRAPTVWVLTCQPDGGSHPHPADACSALAVARDPFAPVRVGVFCSFLYGGPQKATIDGFWHGQPVSGQYNRVNGCEVYRWNQIAAVFGGPDMPGFPLPPSRPVCGPIRLAQMSGTTGVCPLQGSPGPVVPWFRPTTMTPAR
jgi:hypothetical protein